jgi:hypothetical protein
MLQVDNIISLLQSIIDDLRNANALLDESDGIEGLDSMNSIVEEIKDFRDQGVEQFSEQASTIFGLISTISMIIGGVLMATAFVGIVGPATLVCTFFCLNATV